MLKIQCFWKIINCINLTEIFGYVLNGLPQAHKTALSGVFDHTLASSHLFRLDIFEIITYNINHALNLYDVLNRIIKTSPKVYFFLGDWPRAFCCGLTEPLWLQILLDLLFCGSIFIVLTKDNIFLVTSQKFLLMFHMGYLKFITYFFAGCLITPSCLKTWSGLVNSSYLGNKESPTKVSFMR